MSRCDLFLDNYASCYYAGQQVVGRLRCYFNGPKSTAGIFVKITGTAIVEWSESEQRTNSDNKSHTHWTTYRGIHELINAKIQLVYQHGNKIDVPAGEHVFPFTYTLPPDLPSTFNTSTIGKITYIIKGYVDMSFQMDYKAKTEINIAEIFDLNRCTNLLIPVDIKKQKTLGFLCWHSGAIDMSLHVPFTGFVPGQSVPITLCIENLSRTSISAVTFNIQQRIYFYSNTPHRKSRTETHNITDTKDTGVGAHSKRTYELHLQIPSSFRPLNLKSCSVIDVSYSLNVEIVIPGMHRNMKQSIDIKVGNVALVDSNYLMQQYPSVLTLVEPDVDVVGDLDGFALVEQVSNPSAPPPEMSTMPTIPTIPVIPTAPPPSSSISEFKEVQPIGWMNPSEPPSYNDLFEKKE